MFIVRFVEFKTLDGVLVIIDEGDIRFFQVRLNDRVKQVLLAVSKLVRNVNVSGSGKPAHIISKASSAFSSEISIVQRRISFLRISLVIA